MAKQKPQQRKTVKQQPKQQKVPKMTVPPKMTVKKKDEIKKADVKSETVFAADVKQKPIDKKDDNVEIVTEKGKKKMIEKADIKELIDKINKDKVVSKMTIYLDNKRELVYDITADEYERTDMFMKNIMLYGVKDESESTWIFYPVHRIQRIEIARVL